MDLTYSRLTPPITTLSEVLVEHIEQEADALKNKAGEGSIEGEIPKTPVEVIGDHISANAEVVVQVEGLEA